MRTGLAILLIVCLRCASAATFGEGTSSSSPREPAIVQSRMFTLHTLREACAATAVPRSLEVAPAAMTLAAGERIRHGIAHGIVVVARDRSGGIIPAAPIAVDVLPPDSDIFYSQSALDHIEAVKAGRASLRVQALCPGAEAARAEITVTVRDSAPVTPDFCAHYIDQDMALRGESWRFARVADEVLDRANREGRNPVVTTGDFDRDGAADTAFLIQRGDAVAAAICLSDRPRPVHYLEGLFCEDAIGTVEAGTPHHDEERERDAGDPADGVHLSCLENGGATYLYKAGRFERVVDGN